MARKRSVIARDLRTPKYKMRVIPNKKKIVRRMSRGQLQELA